MPGNHISSYKVLSKESQTKLFQSEDEKIAKIITLLSEEKKAIEREPLFLFARLMNNRFRKRVHESDRNFNVDHNCTSCGTCENVCPVSNISLIKGKPQWHHQCQQCLACIHFCPTQAIQIEQKTLYKERYHHPNVSAKEIAGQKPT
jgi:ferredoxin